MCHSGGDTYLRTKVLITGKELLKLYPEYSRISLYHQPVKSID